MRSAHFRASEWTNHVYFNHVLLRIQEGLFRSQSGPGLSSVTSSDRHQYDWHTSPGDSSLSSSGNITIDRHIDAVRRGQDHRVHVGCAMGMRGARFPSAAVSWAAGHLRLGIDPTEKIDVNLIKVCIVQAKECAAGDARFDAIMLCISACGLFRVLLLLRD